MTIKEKIRVIKYERLHLIEKKLYHIFSDVKTRKNNDIIFYHKNKLLLFSYTEHNKTVILSFVFSIIMKNYNLNLDEKTVKNMYKRIINDCFGLYCKKVLLP